MPRTRPLPDHTYKVIIAFLAFFAICFALGLLLYAVLPRPSHAEWRAEMAQEFTPDERRWFNEQVVPDGAAKGSRCCNTSDGTFAQEDIRGGHYWTKYHYRRYDSHGNRLDDGDTGWVEVPDKAVIHEPNRHGSPAVWYFFTGGPEPSIRCYAPGAGL